MKKWTEISPFTGIEEDAPTNAAGRGNVAGIGVGPMGEPGGKKKKRQSLIDAYDMVVLQGVDPASALAKVAKSEQEVFNEFFE